MAPSKKSTIAVQGTPVSVLTGKTGDYISLTDMLRAKDGEFFISDWLRNRNTVEFLGIWESVFNPAFNYGEFATIRSQAGLNSYKISVKEWVEKTNAIGLKATPGRYGGTFAHPDIAFEFGMWISPEFKIYLVKEFRRLKYQENNRRQLGRTARQWREAQPDAEGNIRDQATIEQLVVLTNLESLNSVFIRQGLTTVERLLRLNEIAISQMRTLLAAPNVKRLK